MEHFVAFEHRSGRVPSPSEDWLPLRCRRQGHLLRALNNKIWLIRGTSDGYLLYAVCVAAAVREAESGDYLVDGSDELIFDPPIVMDEQRWFAPADGSGAKLRSGFNRVTDEALVDHLLEIEAAARRTHGKPPRLTRNKDHRPEAPRRRESGIPKRENAAVQLRAMTCAMEYFRLRWANVADVSSSEAYDIHCDDPKGRFLTVKVRGTTSGWESLFLTAAEEQHAREAYPDVALFVLYEIEMVVSPDGQLVGRGGTTHVIDPWDISMDDLTPLIFGCRLERNRNAKHGTR